MRPRRLAVVTLAVATLAAAEDPGEVSATLTIGASEATVGEPVPVSVEVRAPRGTSVERPEVGPEIGPLTFAFEAWDGPGEDPERPRWTWTGTVAAFDTGDLEIPAVRVRFTRADGDGEARTEPVTLRVRSVLPEGDAGAELADLKAPATVAADWVPLALAAGVVALLAAAAAVAWWLQRRYAGRLAAVPAPDDPFRRLPPHEWVYRELQALLDRRLAEQGQVDRFFSELSWIVKRYLSGRYRVELMERTTTEVPGALRPVGAPAEAVASTRELLEQADRVKFAGLRPDPTACRAAVERVYRIVDATRPASAEGRERGAA